MSDPAAPPAQPAEALSYSLGNDVLGLRRYVITPPGGCRCDAEKNRPTPWGKPHLASCPLGQPTYVAAQATSASLGNEAALRQVLGALHPLYPGSDVPPVEGTWELRFTPRPRALAIFREKLSEQPAADSLAAIEKLRPHRANLAAIDSDAVSRVVEAATEKPSHTVAPPAQPAEAASPTTALVHPAMAQPSSGFYWNHRLPCCGSPLPRAGHILTTLNPANVTCKPAASASDAVNHPAHYTRGGVECIDAIEAALGPERFEGYLRGCVIKYLWRADHKGAKDQDLAKAKWYMDRLNREA